VGGGGSGGGGERGLLEMFVGVRGYVYHESAPQVLQGRRVCAIKSLYGWLLTIVVTMKLSFVLHTNFSTR